MESTLPELRHSVLLDLTSGNAGRASELAEQGLSKFPDDAQLNMLYGIALENLGKVDEALPYLKRATVLEPDNPETFHNLAVALLNRGEYEDAEILASEALKLSPDHEKALETLTRCRAGKGEIPFEVESEEVAAPADSVRSSFDDPPTHVLNLGEAWTRIGFGLIAYCIFSFSFLVWHPFVGSTGGLKHDAASIFAFVLYITSGIACLFWMVVDLIDRRERFIWLLPMWICGFAALPVLPLALYLSLARKPSPASGVGND